jgi:hypothetical protein
MKLSALNLKWTLAFAGAVLVGAAGVVLVLTLMGGGGDEQAAAQPAATTTSVPLATHPPEPTGTPEATGPSKPEPPSYPVVIPTLPPDFAFPEKRSCPDGWGRISDDMANYSICVAPGWGMAKPDTGEPLVDVVLHYGEAYIYSPEAFPRPVGKVADRPLDPEADFLTIALFPIRTDTTLGGGCQAQPGGSLAGIPAATCEYKFDPVPSLDQSVHSPSGKWTARMTFIPLPGARPPLGQGGQPVPTPRGGPYVAGLGISVFAANDVMARYGEEVSQILATLEVTP